MVVLEMESCLHQFRDQTVNRMKWLIRLIAVSTLLVSSTLVAEESGDPVNYCLSSETNSEWAELAEKYRDSDTWQRLFALRVGLCAMVHRGDIAVDRATKIFEKQRQIGLQHIRSQSADDLLGT